MAEGLIAYNKEKEGIVGPYAKWPPEPPIGQLPIEVLTLRGKSGEEEKVYLYDLLSTRYGLTQKTYLQRSLREGYGMNE